jgi:hypothetical protein
MKTNLPTTAPIKTIKYALGHFQTRATPSEFIGLNPNADVAFCDGPTIFGANLPEQVADECADFLNAMIACRNAGVDEAETESDVRMPACDNEKFGVALAGAANAIIASAIARFA